MAGTNKTPEDALAVGLGHARDAGGDAASDMAAGLDRVEGRTGRGGQRGQQHARENGDDRDDHQELDEREASP